MIKLLKAACAAGLCALAIPFSAFAQPSIPSSSFLTGDDPDGTLSGFGDAYGVSTAVWGDWLFVGASRETAFRNGADHQDGAVYIYKRDAGGSFVFEQKLTRAGTSATPVGDRFGAGVAAADGWLFVAAANAQDFPGLADPRSGQDGAPADFFFAGLVDVYQYNETSWDFVQTLTAPEPKTSGSFGARSQASHIALRDDGKVAVIGELNNFTSTVGVGQLHTFRFKKGAWTYVESIDPPAGIDGFGDDLVFASNKYLVANADDISDDQLSIAGFALVYQAKGASGKFFATPEQTIIGPVTTLANCFGAPQSAFGTSGLAAGGGVVALADPCATTGAGVQAGAIDVYRLSGGPEPLAFDETIELNEPNLFGGSNVFGALNALAVSPSGGRILIGTARAVSGNIDEGDDVRVYAYSGGAGWFNESLLISPTAPTGSLRAYGDTVTFIDDETAFIRENNFLSPIVSGLKGIGYFHDLTP